MTRRRLRRPPATIQRPLSPAAQARIVALRAELVGRLDRLHAIIMAKRAARASCPEAPETANPGAPAGP
jgi:hypothetical protein